MKKYKVEIIKTYCIDVEMAENTSDEQLIQQAEDILDGLMLRGQEHYKQTGDTEFTVFDVTNTDDPFNP